MGLAAPKRRQKISRDPNNEAWARDTSGFGHKILASQGWKPGEYLGAAQAQHQDHFTAGSASHIKVTLKDDNLGIGARRTGETAENFGLGALANIYGRLSGKETAQEQQQKQQSRADVGRKMYSERRYGPSMFVSGGLLVGDKIQGNEEANRQCKAPPPDGSMAKDKKRRAESADSSTEAATGSATPRGRDSKKNKKKQACTPEVLADASAAVTDKEQARAAKQKRREERQERRERKAAKRAARAEAGNNSAQSAPDGSSSTSEETASAMRPPFGGSRQAVRRRFIQSKRMALDPQAMREILMSRS